MAHFYNPFIHTPEDFDDDEINFPAIAAVVREEEEEENSRQRQQSCLRGSIVGHSTIHRDREGGHDRLWNDYFAAKPVYPEHLFRRRFRMSRNLFLRIKSAVEVHDNHFVQKRDACGVLGLSSLQKITAAMRMLTYRASADSVDDYVRIGESTAIESLKRFVSAIIVIFGDEYKRSPTDEDITRLLAVGELRGFPGMLGNRSPVFRELLAGRAPPANYSINGHDYTMGYYLADGIYLAWETFVKTIQRPRGNKQKKKKITAAQESARKDVEQAFGVLQSRWAIVNGPTHFWDRETLDDIMDACVIMHNMIIEDERGINDVDYDAIGGISETIFSHEQTPEVMEFLQTHTRIRSKQSHSQFQTDLVEHLWQKYGGE